ncbi:glutamine amidotransferase-related protein [Methanosarcina sp. UBA5]|uniref:glutamine amidotransferase-related protein n=1 Tax=Methanosarcina sp. UBA5 TaxID=1915593 RepID=UPI0025EB1321|nr:hypothetical protein [Methanosarcina sp. UBA5]
MNQPVFTKRNPPKLDSFNLLIIMGGPIGVYGYNENPWLKEEKAFIKQAIEAGKTILRIYLGTQLLADILGARFYKKSHMEMGWFPIKASGNKNKLEFLKGLAGRDHCFSLARRNF